MPIPRRMANGTRCHGAHLPHLGHVLSLATCGRVSTLCLAATRSNLHSLMNSTCGTYPLFLLLYKKPSCEQSCSPCSRNESMYKSHVHTCNGKALQESQMHIWSRIHVHIHVDEASKGNKTSLRAGTVYMYIEDVHNPNPVCNDAASTALHQDPPHARSPLPPPLSPCRIR
jgi:hypothetical protein